MDEATASRRLELFAALSLRGSMASSLERAAAATEDVALWIQFFEATDPDGPARGLLRGAHAAALETIAYTELGLARAAIVAIRLQLELLLGFTYFKDHPVEYERVTRTGDGFMLMSRVLEYHKETRPGLGSRLDRLVNAKADHLPTVYGLLSAHVHGQSPFTIPRNGSLFGLVANGSTIADVIRLQEQAGRSISNYFVALFAADWPILPLKPVAAVRSLLSDKALDGFFS